MAATLMSPDEPGVAGGVAGGGGDGATAVLFTGSARGGVAGGAADGATDGPSSWTTLTLSCCEIT